MVAFASDVLDDDTLTREALAHYLAILGETISQADLSTKPEDPLEMLEELIFQLGELQDLEHFEGCPEV